MRALSHIPPYRLGVVIRIARRAPHRDHATVAVSPAAIEPAPGVAPDRNNPPAVCFSRANSGLDVLVRMACSRHSRNPPTASLLSFVNAYYIGLLTPRSVREHTSRHARAKTQHTN